MKEFTKVMKALKDPNRVKIIKMLQHGELCVCKIQEALGVCQPTTSKNLKILEEAGFLNSRKEGLWVCYRLGDGSKNPYAAVLLGNLKHWLEDASEITVMVRKLAEIRRAGLCEK